MNAQTNSVDIPQFTYRDGLVLSLLSRVSPKHRATYLEKYQSDLSAYGREVAGVLLGEESSDPTAVEAAQWLESKAKEELAKK